MFARTAWVAPGWRLACVAVFLLAPLAAAGGAQVRIVAGDTYAVKNVGRTDVLHVRKEPRATSTSVGTIPPDGRWIVASGGVKKSDGSVWAHVGYQQLEGWVDTKFIDAYDGAPRNSAELHASGISVKFLGPDSEPNENFSQPMPEHLHKCPHTMSHITPDNEIAISIAGDMLSHFVNRGFTLKTLCLALTSPIAYDPESGARIPAVTVAFNRRIPLNVPDCFRFGTPLLDCRSTAHWYWGGGTSNKAAARMKYWIKKQSDASARLDGWIKTQLKADAKTRKNFDDVAETEFQDISYIRSPVGGIQIMEISPDFKRGYAYRISIRFSAGDDPEEAQVKKKTSGTQTMTKAQMRTAVPWGR